MKGPSADEGVIWYEGSGTADRRWLIDDERNSVVAVTDASGAALTINTFDEFGQPGASNSGSLQYTGQYWLAGLGLYHYKARAYAPAIGRFLQTDPIGLAGGFNLYAYIENDPLNLADPTGLDPACDAACRANGVTISARRLPRPRLSTPGSFFSRWQSRNGGMSMLVQLQNGNDQRIAALELLEGGGGGKWQSAKRSLRYIEGDLELSK